MADAPQSPSTDDPFLKGVFESPIIKQLQSGDVPPIFVTPAAFGPHAADLFPKLQQGLPQIGLGVVAAPKSGALVAFNPQLTHPDEILKADAEGKLDTVALPLQTQFNSGSTQGAAPAAPQAPGAPAAAPDAAPATPPQSVTAGLISNPNTDPLQRQRAAGMAPQPPTKQAMPSSGILNGLLGRAR